MFTQFLGSRFFGLGRRLWVVALFVLAQPMGLSQTANAATFNLNNCDGFGTACPYVTYGDANSYSLMLNALTWNYYQGGGTGPGNPFYVPSSPGVIQDLIVPATGANGKPVTTNFPGMDNAYPTPNDTAGTVFFTTNKSAYTLPISGVSAPTDPSPTGGWDTTNTWDTSLAALGSFLGSGNTPVFFFNNNQTNSGSAADQNLAVWAQITLTGTGKTPIYFDLTNLNSQYTTPGGGVLNGDPTSYTSTGAGPIAGDNSHTDYVLSGGQICTTLAGAIVPCGDPTAAFTVNNNLGANQAAYAIVVPELNQYLLMANFGGYDALHLDMRFGCDPLTTGYNQRSTGNCLGRSINNGYEQVFIAASSGGEITVPEPGTLALIGLGLAGLGLGRRKARVRTLV